MASQDSSRLAAALTRKAGVNADAAGIATALVATCQAIEAALVPILGARGVAALLKRSLYVISHTHPWIAGVHRNAEPSIDHAALSAAFAGQTATEATDAASALLETFHELLASLVGPSLTERLLCAVWENALSGSSAKDIK